MIEMHWKLNGLPTGLCKFWEKWNIQWCTHVHHLFKCFSITLNVGTNLSPRFSAIHSMCVGGRGWVVAADSRSGATCTKSQRVAQQKLPWLVNFRLLISWNVQLFAQNDCERPEHKTQDPDLHTIANSKSVWIGSSQFFLMCASDRDFSRSLGTFYCEFEFGIESDFHASKVRKLKEFSKDESYWNFLLFGNSCCWIRTFHQICPCSSVRSDF